MSFPQLSNFWHKYRYKIIGFVVGAILGILLSLFLLIPGFPLALLSGGVFGLAFVGIIIGVGILGIICGSFYHSCCQSTVPESNFSDEASVLKIDEESYDTFNSAKPTIMVNQNNDDIASIVNFNNDNSDRTLCKKQAQDAMTQISNIIEMFIPQTTNLNTRGKQLLPYLQEIKKTIKIINDALPHTAVASDFLNGKLKKDQKFDDREKMVTMWARIKYNIQYIEKKMVEILKIVPNLKAEAKAIQEKVKIIEGLLGIERENNLNSNASPFMITNVTSTIATTPNANSVSTTPTPQKKV